LALVRRRILQILLALCVTALTLELGLHLFSFAAQRSSITMTRGADDELTILCVGDSHTWGAGVPEDGNYPAQLQDALRERYPSRRVRVVNAGVPGTNTSYVVRRLEGWIHALDPDAVIAWTGTNNFWNQLESDVSDGMAVHRVHAVLLHSKLYRLATVLWHTRTSTFDVADQQHSEWRNQQRAERRAELMRWMGSGMPKSASQIETSLARDVRRMVDIAHSLDVPILFVTYPQKGVTLPVSQVIARTAKQLGVPVVVTTLDHQRALDDGYQGRQLFVIAAGPHPTALLYGYVVESLLPPLEAALAAGDRF